MRYKFLKLSIVFLQKTLFDFQIQKILILILILFISSCSHKDKLEFENAEAEFNRGNIDTAKVLYQKFVKNFPTSDWRSIAENQLEKCNSIFELKKYAAEFEKQFNFSKAKKTYIKILTLNRAAIDTSVLFPVLINKEEEHLKRKVESENEFIKNINKYLENLYESVSVILYGINSFDDITSKHISERSNEIFAESVLDFANCSSINALKRRMRILYNKILSPPSRYKKCLPEIKNSYMYFNDLNYTLQSLHNYSRITLRNRLAEIDNKVNRSIEKLKLLIK